MVAQLCCVCSRTDQIAWACKTMNNLAKILKKRRFACCSSDNSLFFSYPFVVCFIGFFITVTHIHTHIQHAGWTRARSRWLRLKCAFSSTSKANNQRTSVIAFCSGCSWFHFVLCLLWFVNRNVPTEGSALACRGIHAFRFVFIVFFCICACSSSLFVP